MTESVPVSQHQPAVKVGGRRLSITTKHRSHHSEERTSPDEEKKTESMDYPRPAPTSGDVEAHHDHVHNHYEEEGPHKEKKQNSEKRIQEYVHWKSETTRPTRDLNIGQKGQNIRISQPAGKGFNV